MKNAFIPKILRPEVKGASFNVASVLYAKEIVNNISNINEIIDLYSRRTIIAKVIKNVFNEDSDINDIECVKLKILESLFIQVTREE